MSKEIVLRLIREYFRGIGCNQSVEFVIFKLCLDSGDYVVLLVALKHVNTFIYMHVYIPGLQQLILEHWRRISPRLG